VLIVFSLYLIVLKILFEKGFEKKKRIKQNRKEIGNRKKRERKPPRPQPEHPLSLASAQRGPGSPRADPLLSVTGSLAPQRSVLFIFRASPSRHQPEAKPNRWKSGFLPKIVSSAPYKAP